MLIANRFVHDAALVVLWGANGFAAFAVPSGIGAELSQALKVPSHVAVAIATVTSIASVPINISMLTRDSGQPLFDFSVVYLFQTTPGRLLLLQFVSAASLVAVHSLGMRKVATLIAGVMLYERAMQGHAADGELFRSWITQLFEGAHILAAAAWIGALPVFIVLQRAHRRDRGSSGVPLRAMTRFSNWGHYAVGATILFGSATSLLVLGSLPDPSTTYGSALLLKLAVVVTMALIAVANRFSSCRDFDI